MTRPGREHDRKGLRYAPGEVGDRVFITKLMYKLLQCSEHNYIIAAAARINPYTLSRYARGHQPISAPHLIALCRLFECEPEELIGEMEVELDHGS